ncbi:MAG: hypothetical protein IKF22_03515 [Lachnospiraceae bacterium]|nr:hypothetical protein [Lachnospiraceae bacterium]
MMEDLKKVALELLRKYQEEKEKQLLAIRLSAINGEERSKAKMLKAKLDKEIRKYEKLIGEAGGGKDEQV